MTKLASFAGLPMRERTASFEAMALLLAAKALVALVPLRHWRRHFSVSGDRPFAEPSAETHDTLRSVSRAIRRAERNLPGNYLCLPQALAARWMLSRRGLDCQLRLGTRRAEDGAHEFHAWLKAGSQWVTGHCREADYALYRPA